MSEPVEHPFDDLLEENPFEEALEEWERTGYKGRLAQIFDSPVKPDGNCNTPINKEQNP